MWELVAAGFAVCGALGGAARALTMTKSGRVQRMLETRRADEADKLAAAGRDENTRRDITRVLEEHTRTDLRWFDYETDVAKLLDFPLITDMRNELTVAFHKAKQRADLIRPADAEALLGDKDAQREYRDAVHEYVTAFDVAETEAIRRRRSDFSENEQQRMVRAQHLMRLAQDENAPRAERQTAYAKARKELEGILVLPAATREALERRIIKELEAS